MVKAWEVPKYFWSVPEEDLLAHLNSSDAGISTNEAKSRLKLAGPNYVKEEQKFRRLLILWNQIRSHLLMILVIAAVISLLSGEWVDSSIILLILVASVGMGYYRELNAKRAVEKLKSRLKIKVRVLRAGDDKLVDVSELVPGDVFFLQAGNLVPADARILSSKDLFLNEAVLTGESFPVEKSANVVPADSEISKRSNCVFAGANVRAGVAKCLTVNTGASTEYGQISNRLILRPPETEFDRGVRKFGDFLTICMFVMTLVVFSANLFLERPVVESLLFAVALAVGLSPELLPAILNVNLARAADLMAKHGVIVRNLNAIENLGSMTVLCTDKTGTITEGVVEFEGFFDWKGGSSPEVLRLATINATLQTGLKNPLDEAIAKKGVRIPSCPKIAEIPYDFVRKRMSVIVQDEQRQVKMITKGAFPAVIGNCSYASGGIILTKDHIDQITQKYDAWTSQGIRVLGVATKILASSGIYTRDEEDGLTFEGFLTFTDRPKEGVAEVIRELKDLGVDIKIITGDSKAVAQSVAARVGLDASRALTGKDLDECHEEALWRCSVETSIFAEVNPNQKERVILALKKMGEVVGFLGDGVNDAPAMHAADTSISVDNAVDVARNVADFILFERNLGVIKRGIERGRETFANTLKYILITMSANLGNMISMGVASIFLPFLPMLAGQVLLNNLLSDVPAIGIASDKVDHELVAKPGRWDVRFIVKFMIRFGLVSTFFDFITFAVLIWIFSVRADEFRTAWFVESLLTELAVAFVVRTKRPLFRSSPGSLMVKLSLVVMLIAFLLPYLPFAVIIGFAPLRFSILGAIVMIVLGYVAAAELVKLRLV